MVHKHGHAHAHGLRHRKRSLDDLFDFFKPKRDDDNSNDQQVSVVYKTMPATFDGQIGGYVTGTKPDEDSAPTAGVGPAVQATGPPPQEATTTAQPQTKQPEPTQQQPTQQQETVQQKTAEPETQQPVTHITNEPPKQTENTIPTHIITDPHPLPTTLATAITTDPAIATDPVTSALSMTGLPEATAATTAASGSSPSDKSSDSSSPSTTAVSAPSGLSGGAKAGIAIGVILGVGLIAGLIFFFVRKKKQNQNLPLDDNEKTFRNEDILPPPGPSPMVQTPRTPVNPPQLDIRPVTQFAPDLNHSLAMGAAGATVGSAVTTSRNLTPSRSGTMPQPPNTSDSNGNPFSDPENPFGNQAEASSPPGAANPVNQPGVPGAGNAGAATTSSNVGPSASTVGAVAAGAVAAGAAAGMASKATDKDLPRRPETPASRSQSPAPAGSDAGAASSPSLAAGASPGRPGPMNVHRVQMDFNPSMDDELQLQAGQLVRLLHEYDDGWALCVRLDRSQQGVAPRSCLSARPVKPRPRPPPGAGPGPRGPPVMGPNGRPMSPAGGRMPPGPGPMPKQPRFYPQGSAPMSPGRPMSPARSGPPQSPYPQRPVSPASFPAVPHSLAAGPNGRPSPPRSMSPGPYGPPGARKPNVPPTQRTRSNSAGAAGQSPLAGVPSAPSSLPSTPAPSGKLPDLPASTSTPTEVQSKPVPESST